MSRESLDRWIRRLTSLCGHGILTIGEYCHIVREAARHAKMEE